MASLITQISGYVSFYRHRSFSSHVPICLGLRFQLNCKIIKIKEDHPNENKRRLFIQSLPKQGCQPTSLTFGTDSKGGRGMKKLYGEKIKKKNK